MSSSASTTLLSNASATGEYVRWEGGHGVATFAGTFGGTSATLEYLGPDGATALAVKTLADDGTQTAVALTAAGAIGFILPPGRIRANLTGGTPTGMYAQADRVPS